jgi:drug/metabolite transporter (DMT)-like permease
MLLYCSFYTYHDHIIGGMVFKRIIEWFKSCRIVTRYFRWCGACILKRSFSTAGAQQSLGDLLVVLSSVSYSIYVISIKPLMAKYKAMHILQWVFLFGTFFSLPIGWNALGKVQWQAFDGWSWFALAYCIIGATFLAYQFMNYGIKKLGASITGSYIYTQPFFATIASMIILHESLSLPKIGGAC